MATQDAQLDRKLATIRSGKYTPSDFIIADAKDGDMAFGLLAPGPNPVGTLKTKPEYLDAITAMTESGLIDVMLLSASSAETLTRRGVFDSSVVTPAVRMNDTTDIWMARGSSYRDHRSAPFSTADIDSVSSFCNLGLYSVTFSNDLESDRASLEAYRNFRHAVRPYRFRHFLEVFNPAFDIGIPDHALGDYVNDMVIKAVAGVTSADSPQFLKMQFNGAKAMSELASYDPENLIVGILGGAKGTTRDTFELATQAEQAGARVALFGRKINLSEAPVELVRLMRATIEKELSPTEAVHSYHDHLGENGVTPHRILEDDLRITDPVLVS
ncbi:MAG: hypothetical protein EX267_05935 [Acidimicrobiia bacterium]|nr:MAG: hypothetical protein EX267_05935 [Acidimicrobiia bacterium]